MPLNTPVPAATGDILEQQVTDLLAYAAEIALPGLSRDTARSLLRRVGDPRLAQRRLRERRARLGRQIERAVDEQWLDQQVTAARERHDTNRQAAAQARASRRASRPMMHRLVDALQQATKLPALSTPDFVATGSSSGESTRALPPGGDQDLAEHYWHLITMLTRSLERELDRALYGGAPETREQRAARIVRDYPGLPPHVVATVDRTAGSPDTVERDRHFMGRRMRDGLEHDDAEGTSK